MLAKLAFVCIPPTTDYVTQQITPGGGGGHSGAQRGSTERQNVVAVNSFEGEEGGSQLHTKNTVGAES